MNNIKCQIPNHKKKKITSVCLNKDCKDKRLCCHICVEQLHHSHVDKTIEVEQLNEFIQKESTEEVKFPQSYCYGQLQIIKGLEQLSDLADCLQKVIQEKILLAKQQSLKEFLRQQSSHQQGIEYWNKLIEEILKYFQVNNSLIVPKQQNEGQLSEKEGQQIQMIRNSESSLQEIISQLNLKDQVKQFQFQKNPVEMAGHKDTVRQVAISQDGQFIASGSVDKTVKLWDARSKTLISLSSKNEYLAFSDWDKSIKLFELKLNKIKWTYKKHSSTIRCLIFSSDSQYLLSGGDDQRIIIWSLLQNKIINIFETNSSIKSIVISQENKLVSCICFNGGSIYIWDLITKNKMIQEDRTHQNGYGLCSSADSSTYISSGKDGLIKIWKLNESLNNQKALTLTRSIQAAIKFQIEDSILYYYSCKTIIKVILTPDDLYIISFCNIQGQIMIHERETGKLIQVLESGTKVGNYATLSLSNDLNTLVSSNHKDNAFRVWTRE